MLKRLPTLLLLTACFVFSAASAVFADAISEPENSLFSTPWLVIILVVALVVVTAVLVRVFKKPAKK